MVSMEDEMSEDMGHRHSGNEPVEPAGARGGSAAFAAHPGQDYLTAWAKTIVRWGPIWVGFIVALGINLVLYVLTMAIALSSASPTARNVGDVLQGAGVGTAISSLIALFVGGFLAGRLGIQQGLRNGLMQGTVVWALFVIAMTLFSLFGLGGALGSVAGMTDARSMAAGTDVTTGDAARVLGTAARSAWWLFAGLVISWLAAAIGGWLGVLSSRPDTEEAH